MTPLDRFRSAYDPQGWEEYRRDSAPLGGLIGAVLAGMTVLAIAIGAMLWRH